MDDQNTNYGKRPLWQWVLIYLIIGAVIYGLVYYFVLAKRGGTSYTTTPTTTPTTTSEASPATNSATKTSQETIILTADGFSPKTLTIAAGTKVIWTNQSGADAAVNSSPHPIHTDYPPLNLGSFSNGGTVSLTFDQPGTYKYHNHLKPSQFGTIVVQ